MKQKENVRKLFAYREVDRELSIYTQKSNANNAQRL